MSTNEREVATGGNGAQGEPATGSWFPHETAPSVATSRPVVTEKDVALALLGSWPSQVASWGKEGIAAYLAEIGARDITPAQALVALRSCPPTQRFPPSVPELAGIVRADASAPTYEDMLQIVYGRGGIIRARSNERWFDTPSEQARADHQARVQRCREVHPLVGKFAVDYGIDRLHMLPIDDPEWGDAKRRDLRRAWEAHCAAMAGREIAGIAAGIGSAGGLRRFDPLSVLSGEKAETPVGELEAGKEAA